MEHWPILGLGPRCMQPLQRATYRRKAQYSETFIAASNVEYAVYFAPNGCRCWTAGTSSAAWPGVVPTMRKMSLWFVEDS